MPRGAAPGARHGWRATEPSASPPPISPRVERARRLLETWRASKDAVPIATLVDRILSDSGYEAALLGESLGDRKRANARKLVRMARRLDDAGGFILADFVERLRSDLRAATKETQAATTDDGGQIVRLMSIHQSKGLEFPIVVVPDLDRKRPTSSGGWRSTPTSARWSTPSPRRTTAATTPPPTPAAAWAGRSTATSRRQADDEEALRLFYVASTRARDFLILSAATDPTRPAGSPALSLLDRRFDRSSGAGQGSPSRRLVQSPAWR